MASTLALARCLDLGNELTVRLAQVAFGRWVAKINITVSRLPVFVPLQSEFTRPCYTPRPFSVSPHFFCPSPMSRPAIGTNASPSPLTARTQSPEWCVNRAKSGRDGKSGSHNPYSRRSAPGGIFLISRQPAHKDCRCDIKGAKHEDNIHLLTRSS